MLGVECWWVGNMASVQRLRLEMGCAAKALKKQSAHEEGIKEAA